MKKFLILFSILFLAKISVGQLVTEYWDVAQTKKKSEQNMKDGMQDGKYTAWYENGEIAKEGNFIQGKENGKFLIYYAGKKVKAEENYLKGKKEGAWKYWYINGNKAQETFFKDD